LENYPVTNENEQVEALKEWWQENGRAVIFGLVLGVGSVIGWRGWQGYHEHQALDAAMLHQEMLAELHQDRKQPVIDHGERLIEDYARTPYATFAALTLAKLANQESDYVAAEQHLRWAVDNAREPALRHIARLRLIQILLAQDKNDEALQLIDAIREQGKFIAQYEEFRGDALLKLGKLAEARNAYQVALNSTRPGASHYEVLEMKLDNLGRPDRT
jgi:predicted negative regulator of RcsB-dependent stress response